MAEGALADPDAFADLHLAVTERLGATGTAPPLRAPSISFICPEARECDELVDPATVVDLTGTIAGEAEFRGPSVQMGSRAAPPFIVGRTDSARQTPPSMGAPEISCPEANLV